MLTSANSTDPQYKIYCIDGQDVVAKSVVVHRFVLHDITDDPDLWAAEPLYRWEHSEAGEWVMQHSVDTPVWHRQASASMMGYEYVVVARLTPIDQTFFKLKYQ